MLIGVVSDTHGHVSNARAGARMLESFGVAAVLHCGDIGSSAIVLLLAAWPTHYVFGNVDGGQIAADLEAAIRDAGQTLHGRFGSFELGGTKIALLHGDDTRLLDRTIAEGQHSLICHGHTHVPRIERMGHVCVVNPGALYRANPHSVAIIELPSVAAQIIPL